MQEVYQSFNNQDINWESFFTKWKDWESEYRSNEFQSNVHLNFAMPELKKCRTLFYPGAGYDFSTLKFFMEMSSVKDYYYCDYMNYDITPESVFHLLKHQLSPYGFLVIKAGDLEPGYFNKNRWDAYWHSDHIPFGGNIDHSFITLFTILRGGRKFNLYYFGTEAIQTYDVLLNNKGKIDVVVTQDHGLGGLWTTFCNGSILESLAIQQNKLPEILMVGEGLEPWVNYENITTPFGNFGLHEQPRLLFGLC